MVDNHSNSSINNNNNNNSNANNPQIISTNISSPAMQASVSISSGIGQTNLAHFQSNSVLNEYGVQNISIPGMGMQISIAAPTNMNFISGASTAGSSTHSPGTSGASATSAGPLIGAGVGNQTAANIASVNVNLSNNSPQHLMAHLSPMSSGQTAANFPGGMLATTSPSGLLTAAAHVEQIHVAAQITNAALRHLNQQYNTNLYNQNLHSQSSQQPHHHHHHQFNNRGMFNNSNVNQPPQHCHHHQHNASHNQQQHQQPAHSRPFVSMHPHDSFNYLNIPSHHNHHHQSQSLSQLENLAASMNQHARPPVSSSSSSSSSSHQAQQMFSQVFTPRSIIHIPSLFSVPINTNDPLFANQRRTQIPRFHLLDRTLEVITFLSQTYFKFPKQGRTTKHKQSLSTLLF